MTIADQLRFRNGIFLSSVFCMFLVEHARSLVLAVYKALRSMEGIDGGETDETMSTCSEPTTSEIFVEPDESRFFESSTITSCFSFISF